MNPIRCSGCVRLLSLMTAALRLLVGVRGETLTLQPAGDARILSIDDSPAFQNTNYRDDILSVYFFAANIQRTLLHFDLSAAQPGPGIRLASARLTLTASTGFGGNPANAPMEVWRVTQPWVESEVTWLRASATTLWTTPGGDIAGGPHGPYSVSTANPPNASQVSWDVTELVDRWMEGLLPNHGLLLLSKPGNRLTFRQSESPQVGDLESRPHLVLELAAGIPRLQAQPDDATGGATLSWREDGTAVLQERSALDAPGDWADSTLPVGSMAGRSVVRIEASTASRYFRLRPTAATP